MKSEEFEIYIKGAGGKFNQGFISKTQFNKWNELRNEFSFDLRIWDEFTKEYLEKDGYWDVSEVSAFTDINADLLTIEIYFRKKLYFSGTIENLIEKYFADEEEMEKSNNVSAIYDKLFFPEDWDNFFSNESFQKRENVLMTSMTNKYFETSRKIIIESEFEIKKLGLIKINTDDIGFGKDYGNYILGFVYDAKDVYFEYPGGVGQISILNFN